MIALFVVRPVHAGPAEDFDCDRTGDHKVTSSDALIALRDAVDNCRSSEQCDADGDEQQTATDALLLLRYAVKLPVELACGCLYIDQCIGSADDADCAENGFPGYHCFGSICVECTNDADCDDGAVCDLCSRSCVTTSQLFYQTDFQGAVGPEWSDTAVATTPVGERRFLGQFGPTAATSLSLNELPPHSEVSVSFDLFIIGTWDGNQVSLPTCGSFGGQLVGPDEWRVAVAGGETLLNTTFSNIHNHLECWTFMQAFPEEFPGGDHPPFTNAAEVNTLGYEVDAIYHLSFTFAHAAEALELDFSSLGRGDADEGWGLDNVVVEVGP